MLFTLLQADSLGAAAAAAASAAQTAPAQTQMHMVGNSMMSDIVPALNVGAKAAYIPYHVTWQYEKHPQSESGIESPNYVKLSSIEELTTILQ